MLEHDNDDGNGADVITFAQKSPVGVAPMASQDLPGFATKIAVALSLLETPDRKAVAASAAARRLVVSV